MKNDSSTFLAFRKNISLTRKTLSELLISPTSFLHLLKRKTYSIAILDHRKNGAHTNFRALKLSNICRQIFVEKLLIEAHESFRKSLGISSLKLLAKCSSNFNKGRPLSFVHRSAFFSYHFS